MTRVGETTVQTLPGRQSISVRVNYNRYSVLGPDHVHASIMSLSRFGSLRPGVASQW